MEIIINANHRKISDGDFNYSNIKSRYGVNTRYFTKDSEPYTIIAGEMHFSRLPRRRWKETLLKMRDCGINTVSTYVFWNHHNEKKGVYDFSGDNDIKSFLSVCREIKMPCILRIGPWCHGEVLRGGFPKRIQLMPGNRTNSQRYLNEVRDFWTQLYNETKDFLDGETVIGIQLENEYTGKTEHILTLKKLAEQIGFKTPFFTMTAWPSGIPDPNLLPMMGGYPDAPWTHGKTALKPNNRFAISSAKTENEIGADLHKNKETDKSVYDDVPYAFCEIGPGNQVTQHRRPFISEKDGYGVGFAKFASGAAWLGYYMFCGGRNPNSRLLQENRLSGYPNNYPIIDYDFQSPISRYGECRPHGDRLRLMHLFAKEFDSEISAKPAFFPQWKSNDPCDISFLKCSVRIDEQGSGYFFASTYEKGLKYKDFKDVSVTVNLPDKKIELPKIDIEAGSMFFYPFNIELGGIKFEYITAQPIAKLKDAVYFVQCGSLEPKCKTDNNEYTLKTGTDANTVSENGKDIKIIVLTEDEAKRLHIINGKAVFAEGTVYRDGEYAYCETAAGGFSGSKIIENDLTDKIRLMRSSAKRLPYNYFLYSTGKRSYYELHLPRNILENRFDVRLEFEFDGLNLQVFSSDKLINDYFNIDGKFIMCLKDYEEYIRKNPVLTIRTAPKTKFGISNVYNEIPIPLNSNRLELKKAQEIFLQKEKI